MRHSSDRYCAVGICYADKPDRPQVLAVAGQIVLFSTLGEAQSALPRFGGAGRIWHWSSDQETLTWTPLNLGPGGFNRALILTNYDPYNLPAGFTPGVRSETRSRDWRHHVLWTHHVEGLLAWADGLEMQRTRETE